MKLFHMIMIIVMYPYFTDRNMLSLLLFLFILKNHKHTYCKTRWKKSSAKCPKCKCKWFQWGQNALLMKTWIRDELDPCDHYITTKKVPQVPAWLHPWSRWDFVYSPRLSWSFLWTSVVKKRQGVIILHVTN